MECEADFAEGLTEHNATEQTARATCDQESKEDEIGIVATTRERRRAVGRQT